jgi:type VI secretion system protein ImpB
MTESTQHILDRVRPPRVQITYDVEIGNAIEIKELPYVVGILADLAGKPAVPLAPLKQRKFVELDRDNFDEVFESLNATLPVRVKNTMGGDLPEHNLLLTMKSMDDFNPLNIVKQIDFMNAVYEQRASLSDILSKLDGNDALDVLFRGLIDDPSKLAQLQKELGSA